MSDIKGGEKGQLGRFVGMARQLGCDEDKDRFEAKLGIIARQKPALDKKEDRSGNKPVRRPE